MSMDSIDVNDIIIGDADLRRENELLRNTLSHLKSEIEKMREPPLIIAEVKDVKGDKAIIRLTNGNTFWVNYSPNLKEKLSPSDLVLLEQKSLYILEKLEKRKNMDPENFLLEKKPDVSFDDIGGLRDEIDKIKEVVELPLNNPGLFSKIGITPPKGVLLHGPPGTGKTLLARAVANATDATFIHVNGSELVQKFIGEGAKLIKEMFQLARERAPTVLFIDEIDSLAATRMEMGTSGEREVQRTFMQLLSEIDGFKDLGDVKIIAATNRPDILDPAIMRPGRLDRLIGLDLPDDETRKKIFEVHLKKISKIKIDYDDLVMKTQGYSGAEIAAICTEAGYIAIRDNRGKVKHRDLVEAITSVREKDDDTSYLHMFG